MATVDSKRRSDGQLSCEGGVNSGRAPNLIRANQVSWAVNTTFRGGWAMQRPVWRKADLTFEDDTAEENFQEALFQTAGGYVSDEGDGSLISMQGGRVFKASIASQGFKIQDISIAGDLNPTNITQAWAIQAENYFILQDGQSKPFIYNGGSAVRATERQIPVGKQMAYYMGRIWIANGREYVAGDIVYGPSGSEALGLRDSILYMTENTYLAEGGAFGVPVQAGDITALKPIANLNTALGQGELIAFTENAVFATLVPQRREDWKNTTEPLQRMIQLTNGAFGQDAVVNVNEDLFYRNRVGIQSLAYAVRNSGQWGNTPVSNEMDRILLRDVQSYLRYASGVNFENRLLMTTAPGYTQNRGTYFRALASLDFEPITGMSDKQPPAWEGIWTGLNILKIVTVMHQGVQRCFAYTLSASNTIELYELNSLENFDWDGSNEVRVQWSQELRSMDFGSKFDMKQLFAGDLFFDQIHGEVDFDVDWRPDSHPCWIDWDSWSVCAKTKFCEDDFGTCPTLPNYQPQYTPKRQLVQPPDTFDAITKWKYRNGFEHQVRLTMTGPARVKQIRINAHDFQERPWGNNL